MTDAPLRGRSTGSSAASGTNGSTGARAGRRLRGTTSRNCRVIIRLVSASDGGLASDSVAMAFQMRAIPRERLKTRIRSLSADELAELELETD